MNRSTRTQLSARSKDIGLFVGIGLVCMILGRIPVLRALVYPFEYFDTFIHEISHGVAAMLTGGSLLSLVVNRDGSGLAWTAGGVRWIVVSAGYLGSALMGGLLIVLAARGRWARPVLVGLGLLIGLICLFYVRSLFGLVIGVLLMAALVAAGMYLSQRWAANVLIVVAVQSALNAVDSLIDLVTISAGWRGAATDAQTMQQLTGIPTIIWAILWVALALLILWQAFYWAYVRRPAAPPSP